MAVFRLFLGSGGAPLNTGVLLAQNAVVTGTGTVADTPKVYLRPDGDVALDGWTDQADGTSNIVQTLDETSASDSDYVQSPEVASEPGGVITIGVPNTFLGIGNFTYQKVAQNFISIGGVISSVRVRLTKVGSPTDNVLVKIFTVDAGHAPDTQVGVTSGAIDGSSIATFETPYDFVFTPPVPVSNGVEYCFVVERSGAVHTSDRYALGLDDAAAYLPGQVRYWDGAAWQSTFATYDVICVIDQVGVTDFTVRLFDGAAQIVEWTHTDIADTFTDAVQTLTGPQFEAISSFANLFAEFDDNQGNVYRFALGDPASEFVEPVKIRYRYKKLAA